jgi:hypothetical protein
MVHKTLVSILTSFLTDNSRQPGRIEMYTEGRYSAEISDTKTNKLCFLGTSNTHGHMEKDTQYNVMKISYPHHKECHQCEQVINEAQIDSSKEQEAPSPASAD